LISALVNTLAAYADTDTVLLDVEGHGRENLFDKIDVSRTIGWFTTVYPVAFKSIGRCLDAEYFQSIKSILTAIPGKGIGHGVLREIAKVEALNHAPLAEVCFNYLGKVNNVIGDKSKQGMLAREVMNIGQPRSPKARRAFVFEINCAVVDNKLTLKWSFSNKMHLVGTVEKLALDCIKNVTAIVNLKSVDTPISAEDELFELADIDESDLSAISDLLDNIDEE
jgi:non-ribosomal peptide synthase protein (TIGR01720 family)